MDGGRVLIALGAPVLAGILYFFGSRIIFGVEYETMISDQLFSWGFLYMVSGLLIVGVIFIVIFISRR